MWIVIHTVSLSRSWDETCVCILDRYRLHLNICHSQYQTQAECEFRFLSSLLVSVPYRRCVLEVQFNGFDFQFIFPEMTCAHLSKWILICFFSIRKPLDFLFAVCWIQFKSLRDTLRSPKEICKYYRIVEDGRSSKLEDIPDWKFYQSITNSLCRECNVINYNARENLSFITNLFLKNYCCYPSWFASTYMLRKVYAGVFQQWLNWPYLIMQIFNWGFDLGWRKKTAAITEPAYCVA